MTATATRPRSLLEYLLSLPPDDGSGDPTKRVFETIGGVEVEKRMGAKESILANRLEKVMAEFVRQHRLGETFVGLEIILPGTSYKRKPDACFISNATWPADRPVPDDPWWPVVPDLAIEAVSRTEKGVDTFAKVKEYFDAGTRAVWLIYRDFRTVHCFDAPTRVRILTAADTLTGDPVLPGFALPLADLFPPAAPGGAP